MVKILFDFLPIVLFFGTFKFAEGRREAAAAFANEHLGVLVSDGHVGTQDAPLLLATVVVILATLGQMAWLKLRGRKIDWMLWASFVMVAGLGGLGIWLKSETFIKWKPTGLYWLMAAAFALAPWLARRNLLKLALGEQLTMPETAWRALNRAWVAFFAAMGVLNLWVAYHFPTEIWVDFKLFGVLALTFVFMVLQGVYISRRAQWADDGAAATSPPSGSTER